MEAEFKAAETAFFHQPPLTLRSKIQVLSTVRFSRPDRRTEFKSFRRGTINATEQNSNPPRAVSSRSNAIEGLSAKVESLRKVEDSNAQIKDRENPDAGKLRPTSDRPSLDRFR